MPVSVLFNEPKLLKFAAERYQSAYFERGFSALQRAEIAEMERQTAPGAALKGFSALQRAEIAEMRFGISRCRARSKVSVLFNEPKLLKFEIEQRSGGWRVGFSALQRAEIAEIEELADKAYLPRTVSVLFNEPKLLKY